MFYISRNMYLSVFAALGFAVCFVAAMVVALAFYYDSKNVADYIFHPSLLIWGYKDWIAEVFSQKLGVRVLMPLWLPFLAVLSLFVFLKKLIKRNLERFFAVDENVADMGLFDGAWMALGQVGGKKIQIDTAFTALVWGEKGVGKTSSVAIPSVLESDVGNLLVIEESGMIAKLTSGYRAQIGTVFYLNFDEQDDIATGKFFARWNPLSPSNIPPKGIEREEYIAIVARSLMDRENDYWGKMAYAAMESLLMCFVEKIEQATANDYFVDKILGKSHLDEEDIDILISHYATMPKKIAIPVIAQVKKGKVGIDDYLPIGSWFGIPQAWQGKELSMSMVSDFLLQSGLSYAEVSDFEKSDTWKPMLEYMIREAKLFGYSIKAINMLEYLLQMPSDKCNKVFALLLDMLAMFKDIKVRERTSISDFTNRQLRGIRDVHGKLRPVTIYVKAEKSEAKELAKFMLKVLSDVNISRTMGLSPIAVIIDDFEKFGKFRGINKFLRKGGEKNISFLMLGQSLEQIKNDYTQSQIEEFMDNMGYKVFMANSGEALCRQLEFMSEHASKSIQMELSLKTKKPKLVYEVADRWYYSRASRVLRKQKIGQRYELIFAEGYYYLPIKANQLFYQQKEDLRNKAKIEPAPSVGELYLKMRNMQDVNSPELEKVFGEIGINAESFKEELSRADEETIKEDNVAQSLDDAQPVNSLDVSENCEWWMSEDAFNCKSKEDMNPFK